MPRKKKARKFRAVTAVKALARERIGEPRPAAIVPGKKKSSEKHKKTFGQLLQEE